MLEVREAEGALQTCPNCIPIPSLKTHLLPRLPKPTPVPPPSLALESSWNSSHLNQANQESTALAGSPSLIATIWCLFLSQALASIFCLHRWNFWVVTTNIYLPLPKLPPVSRQRGRSSRTLSGCFAHRRLVSRKTQGGKLMVRRLYFSWPGHSLTCAGGETFGTQ